MQINTSYKIYYLDKFTTNGELVLIPETINWNNQPSFDSEEDAIQWLIDHDKFYQDYIILKHFYITES